MTVAKRQEVAGVTHIGLCVSDFDRSLRLSTEGLGFELAEGYDIPSSPPGRGGPADRVRAQMIVKDGWKLELLAWSEPPAEGAGLGTRRKIGFTHLSVHVADLAAVEARLIELGATPIESTRSHIPMRTGSMDVLFLADPDGIRIELVQVNP
jgi:catechol 2,3-dioxygenase-like lactoylglutathione lyase family enzyme